MKKALYISGIIAALCVAAAGSLAFYVYNLDFGVDYKGRPRLDYNWKYYFTDCPKESHEYSNEFFSFLYPKFQAESPLVDLGDMVSSHDQLFLVFWDKDLPVGIKSELPVLLSSSYEKPFPASSQALLHWLLPSVEETDFNDAYRVEPSKMMLKNGTGAILRFALSSRTGMPDYKIVVGLLHDGSVFKLINKVRLNVSEESYRRWEFPPLMAPRPWQDAQRACVVDRFLGSLEMKKW